MRALADEISGVVAVRCHERPRDLHLNKFDAGEFPSRARPARTCRFQCVDPVSIEINVARVSDGKRPAQANLTTPEIRICWPRENNSLSCHSVPFNVRTHKTNLEISRSVSPTALRVTPQMSRSELPPGCELQNGVSDRGQAFGIPLLKGS
ncbi:hypothetical protein ACVWZV_009246 [Bradyrhizobium sp. GM5.1]